MTHEYEARLPAFPILKLAGRFSAALPPLAALLALLVGAWASYRTGAPDFAIGGAIAALVLYTVVRGALELVSLVVELLIPH